VRVICLHGRMPASRKLINHFRHKINFWLAKWLSASTGGVQFIKLLLLLFSLALQPSVGYGLLVTRGFLITHSDAPRSVGFLWTSDQLVAETSTWQHATDKLPCLRWDWNPRLRQASGCRPTSLDRSASGTGMKLFNCLVILSFYSGIRETLYSCFFQPALIKIGSNIFGLYGWYSTVLYNRALTVLYWSHLYMITFLQITCYRLTSCKHTTKLKHQFIFSCTIMRLLHTRACH
jgi:hypothetical protein